MEIPLSSSAVYFLKIMEFTPCFLTTGIGSMPHKEAAEAVENILLNFKQIPFWPQLPKRSFLESMYVQFSEKLPGVLINEEKRTIYVDTKQVEEQLEECYQHYLSDDTDYFAITPEYAQGLYALLEKLNNNGQRFIKGQITGPISFGLTVTDENKRSIIYNPLLAEALIKMLAMKVKWQIRKLRAQSSELRAIIFIDEPYLASVGSAYVSLKKEDIIKYTDEVIAAIHTEGAWAGIHCCGNTDWSIILDTKADIISFDAYNFIDNLSLFSEKLKDFLEQGRVLAWGIVPASEAIDKETTESLTERLEKGIGKLCKKGLEEERIASLSLITPSCGTGTLSTKSAESVLKLTYELSEIMKEKTQGENGSWR